MWCRVAWEEVCSDGVEAIFAGELLQGVAPGTQQAAAATKVSDDMGAATSVAIRGMGDGDSEAQSIVELPCKAAGAMPAAQAREPLWFLVRGAYVASTHVVGELPLLAVCCVVRPLNSRGLLLPGRPSLYVCMSTLCTCGIVDFGIASELCTDLSGVDVCSRQALMWIVCMCIRN